MHLKYTNYKSGTEMKPFFPSHHYYTSHHLWLRPIGRQDIYVGITDYAQKESGTIESLKLSREGTDIQAASSFGFVYGSNKSIDLIVPFNGRILMINESLIQRPGLINSDPYNYWLAVVSIQDKRGMEFLECLSAEEYMIAVSNFKS